MGIMNAGDRIKSVITLGYKTINAKGEETIMIKPFETVISDQSPEAASAHLISIVQGILGPAQAQTNGKR